MTQHILQPLLAPRSAVVLTGDNPTDPLLLALLKALTQPSSKVELKLVGCRPETEAAKELPQCSALADLKSSVDLAILVGKHREPMAQIISECQHQSIKALLMLTWTDTPVEELRQRLKNAGIRMLGPNSFGLSRPALNFHPWLGLSSPINGPLSLLSQSGTLASALVDWARWQGIGFSSVVTLGEPVDEMMPSQVLDYFTVDISCRAILMYAHHVGHPTRFLSSLRAAGGTKPVAVVAEHALGASEPVLDAALARTGAVRGRRIHDLVAAAAVMTSGQRLGSGRLMIIGNGAAPGHMAAERAARLRVELLEPSAELQQNLSQVIADQGRVGPVTTVWANGGIDLISQLATTALQDNQCGAVLLMISPTALLGPEALYDQVVRLQREQRKLLMLCLLGGEHMVALRTRINAAGVPTFRTPEAAIDGFQFLTQFRRNQYLAKQLPTSQEMQTPIDLELARFTLNELLATTSQQAIGEQLHTILRSFNIHIGTPELMTSPLPSINVRIWRDPVFGPAIGLSVGPVHEPVTAAPVVGLPPLNTALANDLVTKLLPHRERTTPHANPLLQLLLNLSSMLCELPELQTLDLLNLKFGAHHSIWGNLAGQFKPCQQDRRYQHLAIQPYPRQWVQHLRLRDQRDIVVRPVRIDDGPMMAQFVQQLSPEARYFRYFSNISTVTDAMLARFCHIDYDREMELLAIDPSGENEVQLGAAHYSDNFDGSSCEFAVVVSNDSQGLGLAAYLMRQLFLIAADNGLRWMTGSVLAENRHMIEFCRRLGFRVRNDPEDFTTVIAEIELTPELIQQVSAKQQRWHLG